VSGNGLLKMKELAEASGVSAGTIKHYLREGLLGEGTDIVKTSRNMAWYPPEYVERIKLIKQLQEERFMPLKVIKSMLDEDPERTRALVELGLEVVHRRLGQPERRRTGRRRRGVRRHRLPRGRCPLGLDGGARRYRRRRGRALLRWRRRGQGDDVRRKRRSRARPSDGRPRRRPRGREDHCGVQGERGRNRGAQAQHRRSRENRQVKSRKHAQAAGLGRAPE